MKSDKSWVGLKKKKAPIEDEEMDDEEMKETPTKDKKKGKQSFFEIMEAAKAAKGNK